MSIPRNLGNFADNLTSTGTLNVGGINATGTPSSTTVLAGNGSWVTPSAGALVYISTQTVSSAVASVNFTSGFSSTYNDYVILFSNVTFSATEFFAFRFYKGGSLVTTSTYIYGFVYSTSGSGAGFSETGTSRVVPFGANFRTTSSASGNVYLYETNTSGKSSYVVTAGNADSAVLTSCQGISGGGINTASGTVSGISFYCAGGGANLLTGTFKLYGVAKS